MNLEIKKLHVCCFLGHREINETEELKQRLYSVIEDLILKEKVDTFLFGSKSRFNGLCYETVSKIKEKYPNIKRIYVRAEFPNIDQNYKEYLLENYEDTYYPEKAIGAGRAAYVQRNYEMIEKSQFCVVYFCENNFPKNRKSGTKIALDYAVRKNKKIILLP
ncbi:MAG: DUF1273 family protein [Clostridia bacterium]|nr:DUF1273 family protein [Clostridia bacterium]